MPEVEAVIDSLRIRGYRITPQRELIISAVAKSDQHISAEEIQEELKKHTSAINIATVYRTLDMLWQEGFAYRNDLSEGRITYALTVHGHHVHLVCRKCKGVINANPDSLETLELELLNTYDFEADLDHLSIFGVCMHCRD